MRGRPRQPEKLRLLRGTSRRKRADEPRMNTTAPQRPPELDADAAAMWDQVVADMQAAGTLARCDLGVLSAYCSLWSRFLQAERGQAEFGLVIRSSAGAPQLSPYFGAALRIAKEMRGLAETLGLTPAARTRVRTAASSPARTRLQSFLENDQSPRRNTKGA